MPFITEIKPQKNKKRFNIFVDGKFSFALPAESLAKVGIKTGDEISSKQIRNLIKENEFQKFLDKALRFLSFRPRSLKEILDFLVQKQAGEETTKMILTKLENMGVVDDLAFSRWWLEQRHTFKPAGKRLLKLELRRKGIGKEIIEQLLELLPKESEEELARKVLEKKKKQLEGLSRQDFYKRASGYLLRRGFSWEIITKVIKRIDV